MTKMIFFENAVVIQLKEPWVLHLEEARVFHLEEASIRISLEGGVGVLGTCKSTCISENITLMKIGPFESYSKWSGELGTVGCLFIACSLPWVCSSPQGHFYHYCKLYIPHGN